MAGVIPVASFAQTKRICELCEASIPPPLEAAFPAAGGDPEREFELGVAYAAQQCSELLIAGAPGIHFYALNRAPATRAVLGALKASRPWERTRGDAGTLAGRDRRVGRDPTRSRSLRFSGPQAGAGRRGRRSAGVAVLRLARRTSRGRRSISEVCQGSVRLAKPRLNSSSASPGRGRRRG